MAGLWGARNSNDRRLLAELGGEIVEAPPRDYWDYDQVSVIGKSRNVQFKKTPTSVCHMRKKVFELVREDGVGEGALLSVFLERSSVSHFAPQPIAFIRLMYRKGAATTTKAFGLLSTSPNPFSGDATPPTSL